MLTIICQAAAAGLPLAETMLGALSAEGAFGVSKDETQARYWLKRASQKGDAKAMLGLHELYWAGRGGPQMKREAIVLLKIAAQAELPDAQYLLGLLYIMGVDEELPQDIRAAYEWLKRAEAAGHPKAADVMSQMRLQYPELK